MPRKFRMSKKDLDEALEGAKNNYYRYAKVRGKNVLIIGSEYEGRVKKVRVLMWSEVDEREIQFNVDMKDIEYI